MDFDYWRKLWYREAVTKWSWPHPQEDFKAMDKYAKLLDVGHVLGDPAVTSATYSWNRRYILSKHRISSHDIIQIWKDLLSLRNGMHLDDMRAHYFAFLEVVGQLVATKGQRCIDINAKDIHKLIKLGSKLGQEAITKLKPLIHPDDHSLGLQKTMIFVNSAMDHNDWHHFVPHMLSSTVEHLFYSQRRSCTHAIAQTEVRFIAPYKKVTYCHPSPTIAEIKFLMKTIQELNLDSIWYRLQCKVSSLTELDLEEFSTVLSKEDLKRLKEYRNDASMQKSFEFPPQTGTWVSTI